MPTTLGDDVAELAAVEDGASPLALALSYRIAKKQLLSAVAGRATTSADTSAFAVLE